MFFQRFISDIPFRRLSGSGMLFCSSPAHCLLRAFICWQCPFLTSWAASRFLLSWGFCLSAPNSGCSRLPALSRLCMLVLRPCWACRSWQLSAQCVICTCAGLTISCPLFYLLNTPRAQASLKLDKDAVTQKCQLIFRRWHRSHWRSEARLSFPIPLQTRPEWVTGSSRASSFLPTRCRLGETIFLLLFNYLQSLKLFLVFGSSVVLSVMLFIFLEKEKKGMSQCGRSSSLYSFQTWDPSVQASQEQGGQVCDAMLGFESFFCRHFFFSFI